MSNTLLAIYKLISNPITEMRDYNQSRNRINAVGDALALYVKDLYADSFEMNEQEQVERHSEVFSYLGNQNNPPDAILNKSDAIEVKKIEGKRAQLALNSSYPKSILYSNSSMITDACRVCEQPPWTTKDIAYIIGHITNTTLKYIFIVYGDCYAAKKETYKRITDKITNGIVEIPGIELASTNELARINKVDPLGITDFRVRGMWQIQNPCKVFSYIDFMDDKASFQLSALMKTEKFDSFPNSDKQLLLNFNNPNFLISDVRIKNPDNPAQLMNAKLITFRISQ